MVTPQQPQHLCVLIEDDGNIVLGWAGARLRGYSPAVTKATVVKKVPVSVPPVATLKFIHDFGSRYCSRTHGVLVLITHGAQQADNATPLGGSITLGGGYWLTRMELPKIAFLAPYFSDVILASCGAAGRTPAHWTDPDFDGNGPAFCQTLANTLECTVHASEVPMSLSEWYTPWADGDVMDWVDYLKKAGRYRKFVQV